MGRVGLQVDALLSTLPGATPALLLVFLFLLLGVNAAPGVTLLFVNVMVAVAVTLAVMITALLSSLRFTVAQQWNGQASKECSQSRAARR